MRRRIAVLAFVSCALAPAAARAQQPAPPPHVIVTNGEAIIKKAPDQAWVNITAEARAATSADAQRQAAESMRAVMQALTKAGLPSNAVRTTSYSIQPDVEYQNGRQRVKGYIARNSIEARVDDLDRLPAVIDAAGSSGAASMGGLRFDVKDRATIERDALKAAVQDAMARAKAIADGAGKALGDIVRIDEQGDSRPPTPMYRMEATMAAAAAPPPTPITAGDIEIRGAVTLQIVIR
jgi:uncharacterized protein YggE